MFRLSALAGIAISGLGVLVGNGSSQAPRESAGQMPSGWSELGLSNEQRTKIRAVDGEFKAKIAELERQLKELQAEQRRKMVAVLTSDQKERLRGRDTNAEPIIVEQTLLAPIGRVWDAIVTFELTPSGQGTHLKLTHRGHETFPKDEPVFSRQHCVEGWTYFICQSLKTFLDGQKK
jgi:hypothetical protein